MAFDLLDNNLSGGPAVISAPAGVNATAENFIDDYTYAQKFAPELIPQLHSAYGKGKILKLTELIGNEDTYASDKIQHSEEGRLHNFVKDVSVAGNVFTSSVPHNARVKDTIMISDGTSNWQAEVQSITSPTVFTATTNGAAFNFAGNVDILIDFTNSWPKGDVNFTTARRWDPAIYENFTHIVKEYYEVNGSDMAHKTWIETPEGPMWHNHEMMRTANLFDNKVEFTHFFHERKASGNDRGMNGVIPQIEQRGNIANEYITTIEQLSDIVRRLKQQGGGCNSYNIWHDHTQGAHFRRMFAGVNAHYAGGGNYGAFDNSRDMSLALGFNDVYIDGITFFFQPWEILDNPSLMGSTKFRQTGIAYLMVPNGNTSVYENGESISRPYLSVRYRGNSATNRKRQVKLFGPDGTPQVKDAQSAHWLSECTNQVAGANNYLVGRGTAVYS
jgi:hypothetical protein